jgi:hypothetical protein
VGNIGGIVRTSRSFKGLKLGDIVIEQKINAFFGDAESTGFGTVGGVEYINLLGLLSGTTCTGL